MLVELGGLAECNVDFEVDEEVDTEVEVEAGGEVEVDCVEESEDTKVPAFNNFSEL